MRPLGFALAAVLIASSANAQTRSEPQPGAQPRAGSEPVRTERAKPERAKPERAERANPDRAVAPRGPVLRPDERIANPKADRPRAGELRIGVGHGIGFLPLYLAQDLKLFDKHARAAGLNGRIELQRFYAAAPLQQALEKGEIAAGAYGLSAFLLAREKAKPMVAISGLTTLPLVLLTSRPEISSLSDIKPGQRIAVPLMTAPQMTYLRMKAEQWFAVGLWPRLREQVVVMPHQDALDALTEGKRDLAAYFSSPPYTQVAMKDPKVRAILSSEEALGGKSSFFVIASPRATLSTQPRLAEVVSKAIDEAAAIIDKDPKRAALTWLKYEPSHKLDARAVEGVLREMKEEFGSGVYGVSATSQILAREGRLKSGIADWKEVVAPAVAAGPGS